MTEKLPDSYKADVEEVLLKRFEYEFHSAGYHTLVEVITGLRTVVSHLMKVSIIVLFVKFVLLKSYGTSQS